MHSVNKLNFVWQQLIHSTLLTNSLAYIARKSLALRLINDRFNVTVSMTENKSLPSLAIRVYSNKYGCHNQEIKTERLEINRTDSL